MTRIIAGLAGGRRLRTPTGDSTRPTSDRVREALFSSIESELGSLVGLRFLDLYAGSGAVGLEAMSRGAAVATLVEQDPRTASLIRHNSRATGLPAEVVTAKVANALSRPPVASYDVAFLDPPYSATVAELSGALTALADNGWLGEEALVVVERATRSPEPTWPDRLVAGRARRYGETTLWYGLAASRT